MFSCLPAVCEIVSLGRPPLLPPPSPPHPLLCRYKTVREIVTLERMHRAFADGLMEYGMMKAVKAPAPAAPEAAAGGAGAAEGSAAAAAAAAVLVETAA